MSFSRSRGFSFLEVLLVLGIVGLMILCVIGYFLSLRNEPMKAPPATPAPAETTPAPALKVPVVPATPQPAAEPAP